MNATSFDALEVARDLKAAGVPEAQAEAHAAALRKAAIADREELVTKADLHRALWVQRVAIVGMVGGLIAMAASLQLFP